MITELARVRSLVVRPSSVIAQIPGSAKRSARDWPGVECQRRFDCRFIHAGERFRVTAQLIDVGSGELLWSDRIDTAASDIIALQDTIAQRIVEGLRVELSPAEQDRIAKASTQNPAAYEQYLRGRDLFARFIFRTLSRMIATARSSISSAPSNSIQTLRWPTTVSARVTSIASSKGLAALKITNAPKQLSRKRSRSIQTSSKRAC